LLKECHIHVMVGQANEATTEQKYFWWRSMFVRVMCVKDQIPYG
jgi:hypothetical protein